MAKLSSETERERDRVVILSAYQDYRTAKRASIQQVAAGLRNAGCEVTFVSTRFSWLSRLTGDSRLFLWERANRMELVDGVHCYLWRTTFHPFSSRSAWLNPLMARLYPIYAELPNRRFDALIRNADYVIVESSVAAIFLRRLRRLNPKVKIIYYATDQLDTVGAHPFVTRRLEADSRLIDHYALRSPQMAGGFSAAADRLYRAEFGIDPADYADVGPSPYPAGARTVVSVGSMLFDPAFFQAAAVAYPDVAFHVIGCGTSFAAPANVHIHPEMPFRETLPWVKHASVGTAPYLLAPHCSYLADSSLKLAQYEHFGLPAVCPDFAVGSRAHRFGYRVGDTETIVAALDAAFADVGKVPQRTFLTWDEVALRVIRPQQFAGTRIAPPTDGS